MIGKCEILSVGTELLLGNIVNTDARDISVALAELGINVYWHTVVGDNPQRLRECVKIAAGRADLIITTGGLGPTYDDLTKNVLAESFGRKLVFHEEEAQRIRNHYMLRGYTPEATENNLAQAWLPEDCVIFPNSCGTAPGCRFEVDGVTVMMLPGPPNECRAMLYGSVVPYLRGLSGLTLKSHIINVFGLGESGIETMLRPLMESMKNPTLAPYAKTGEVTLRLTAAAESEEKCEELMVPYLKRVQNELGDLIYGIDSESMEKMLVELLTRRGETVCAAESCTGGLFAKRLTDVSGASNVLHGSFVTYCNEAKSQLLGIPLAYIEEKNAVSPEVAALMAKGARERLGADWGVGITGVAGPNGDGTGIPVGTVYAAVSCGEGTWVRALSLGTDRDRNRTLAVNHAIDVLRRLALGMDPKAEKAG